MTSQGGGLNENYEYFLGNMDIRNMYSNRGFESHPLRHFYAYSPIKGFACVLCHEPVNFDLSGWG